MYAHQTGEPHVLAIASDGSASYSFLVTGSVEGIGQNGHLSSSVNDDITITDNGDGTFTVEGTVSSSTQFFEGDTFSIDGDLANFTTSAEVFVNGRRETVQGAMDIIDVPGVTPPSEEPPDEEPPDEEPPEEPSTTIIEDFEHGNLAGLYTNDTGGFSITTSVAESGAALECSDPTELQQIYSNGGFSPVPAPGTEFEFWARANQSAGTSNTAHAGMYFGLVDTTVTGISGYRLYYQINEGDLLLQRMDDNTRTQVEFDLHAYDGYSAGEWVRVNCRWDDGATFGGAMGDFTVRLFDGAGTQLTTFSGNDSTYTPSAGEIGWLGFVDSGSQVFLDSASIVE